MKAALECQDAEQSEKAARKVIALGVGRVGTLHLREARQALPEAVYLQALALAREQKYGRAATRMKEAVRLNAKNAWYRTYKGELEKLAERDAFDRHALETPAEEEKTVAGLARYLVKPAKNDRDKARLIFRWVTNRLDYDVVALYGNKRSNYRPADVLARRLCVCEGYANLYAALAREAGLEIDLVYGRTKSRIAVPGGKPLGHVWVAVKIDGQWQLLDPTWGAGNLIVEKRQFVRRYNDFYFLVAPEKLIYTHLPREERWQLLAKAVSGEEFDHLGYINAVLFDYGVKLEDLQKLTGGKDFKGVVRGSELRRPAHEGSSRPPSTNTSQPASVTRSRSRPRAWLTWAWHSTARSIPSPAAAATSWVSSRRRRTASSCSSRELVAQGQEGAWVPALRGRVRGTGRFVEALRELAVGQTRLGE